MSDLTPLQRQVLDFLVSKLAPVANVTVREVGASFGSPHPNASLRVLRILERKGYISRRDHRTGIRVLKTSGGAKVSLLKVAVTRHREAET